jgi:hypothetical protein
MAKSSVEDFLKQLEHAPTGNLENRRDSQLVRVLYEGRALGRTDTHLHLATETGVLAIPLEQITDVTPLNRRDSSVARIYAISTDAVQYVPGGKPLEGPLEVDPDRSLARLAEPRDGAQGLVIEVVGYTGTIIIVFAAAPAAAAAPAGRGLAPLALDDIVVILCW